MKGLENIEKLKKTMVGKVIKLKDGSVIKVHENGDIETALDECFLESNFEGSNVKEYSLEEYMKSGLSTGWHFDSLKEELYDFISDDDREILEHPKIVKDVQLEIGDIVLVKKDDFIDNNEKDRFLIVINKEKNIYYGYEMMIDKENKHAKSFKINDILESNISYFYNQCYIDYKNVYKFSITKLDIARAEHGGLWKGRIKKEFIK